MNATQYLIYLRKKEIKKKMIAKKRRLTKKKKEEKTKEEKKIEKIEANDDESTIDEKENAISCIIKIKNIIKENNFKYKDYDFEI